MVVLRRIDLVLRQIDVLLRIDLVLVISITECCSQRNELFDGMRKNTRVETKLQRGQSGKTKAARPADTENRSKIMRNRGPSENILKKQLKSKISHASYYKLFSYRTKGVRGKEIATRIVFPPCLDYNT